MRFHKGLFEFFTIGLSDAFLSDYLTVLKLHSTKQISSKIVPSGVLTHNLQIISPVLYHCAKSLFGLVPTCEVVHGTKESSLQKSPTDSLLTQLAEHGTNDLEVMGLNPTEDNF